MKTLKFLWRTRLLLAVMLLANWLTFTGIKFACLGRWEFDENKGGAWVPLTPIDRFGAVLYFAQLASLVFYAASIWVHFRYPRTLDADSIKGKDVDDWNAITPAERTQARTWITIGFAIALALIAASVAKGGTIPVDQVARWNAAQIDPRKDIALNLAIEKYQATKWRYEKIQAMRPNGVPAPILFCLHYRECDNSFRQSPAQGDSLQRRSVNVPAGRIPDKEPPYTFEQAAFDAYYVCEHPPLDAINWDDLQAALDKMESFNGFGYRARGINAPYLWSGTSLYHGGKYIRDGVFSKTAMDAQLGCVAILKAMEKKGIFASR